MKFSLKSWLDRLKMKPFNTYIRREGCWEHIETWGERGWGGGCPIRLKNYYLMCPNFELIFQN
jgi:hypothetical protein